MEHKDLPWADLMPCLQPSRNLNRASHKQTSTEHHTGIGGSIWDSGGMVAGKEVLEKPPDGT
eukprot:CAMPEP_0196749010 /NCGR_PEP_ID=MMETSP1091-20130531/75336_1 /TAXON_ID=302021 /ORGANISM="Rhodomonas sp., Strain CCMP768" /LENGTH=61 /DNA_ID=CAMNT_0042096411 /DNA_START=85 /DNA_END=270 /DNA_ORIENTATION=+